MKGIQARVLRHVYNGQVSDCTNNGVTSKCDEVILVGPNVPQDREPREGQGVLRLILRTVGGRSFYIAAPLDAATEGRAAGMPYMYGGNYIEPDFDRLEFNYPIKVFDRKE